MLLIIMVKNPCKLFIYFKLTCLNFYYFRDYTSDNEIQQYLLQCSTSVVTTKTLYLPSKLTLYLHSINQEYIDIIKSNKNVCVINKFEPTGINYIVIKKSHKLSCKILGAIVAGIPFLIQEGTYLVTYILFLLIFVFRSNSFGFRYIVQQIKEL